MPGAGYLKIDFLLTFEKNLPVVHPAETVRIDVGRLSREPSISPRIKISGYSYDVKTGLLTAVVPARSR